MQHLVCWSGCSGSFPEIVITAMVVLGLGWVVWFQLFEWRDKRKNRRD